jgi:hypothetical protein
MTPRAHGESCANFAALHSALDWRWTIGSVPVLGASIQVSGADADRVTVRMRVTGSEKQQSSLTLDATQNGNGVTATMRQAKSRDWFTWGSWRSESSIEVTVPTRYEVSLHTGGDVKPRSAS